MTIEDICNLNVSEIAAKDCLLFLWTTGPKLNLAFDVIERWGFRYATVAFVWEKRDINPGSYTLSSTEYVLVARKGNIPNPRGRRDIRQFYQGRRTKHSSKPPMIRSYINEMFPDSSKIELFARKEDMLFETNDWKGWDVWGNEVKSDIELSTP